jgi:hypothetical protein
LTISSNDETVADPDASDPDALSSMCRAFDILAAKVHLVLQLLQAPQAGTKQEKRMFG